METQQMPVSISLRTPRIPRDQEAVYRRLVSRRIVRVIRIGLVAGMVFVPAFIVNDLMFDADALRATGPVRLVMTMFMAAALAGLFIPAVVKSPTAISWITAFLYLAFALGLVLIQANHANGFVVSVPGYIQTMIFLPIICFSFRQAIVILVAFALVGVGGSLLGGASKTEVLNLLNWLIGSAGFALGAAYVVNAVSRRSFELERELTQEKARTDELMLNILPAKIALRLKNKEQEIADYYPCATVLFADLVGFTALSRNLEPGDLVELLNDLFQRFDHLAESFGIEKIKTIGDGYMAVAGLSGTRTAPRTAMAVAELALAMRAAFEAFRSERGAELGLRLGIHSGPVVAGVIGSHKFTFDLWGDTVNVASRIERACPPDKILVSRETAMMITPEFITTALGEIEIRGHQRRAAFILEAKAAAPEIQPPSGWSGASCF
jgi:class 3 adenylate cyclase